MLIKRIVFVHFQTSIPTGCLFAIEPNYNWLGDTMDTIEIIQSIDAEIARLEQARNLLNGHTAPPKRGRPASSKATATPKPAKRRKMSAEGRARIAAAQRARWAKAKGK
jgi:hypothetical protein